ncbi:integrin alpha-3-like isoform X2 [Nelusetta ayraudi]|uniref:integrin alpha-3-like isoform X2 n=1 Tax=Nelusetta ayraudi TaxID=303726 RepID=UPI003F718F0B
MGPAVCVCVCVCVVLGVCVSINLDTRFPLLKEGGAGSYFGLSVALHQDLKTGAHLLLVGAPREEAEPNVPANRTGGVYSCQITADQSDCSRMKLFETGVAQSEELLEDMWLGVSVASQGPPGGRVLVCGHRSIRLYGVFQRRHMIGRCYLRGNDLRLDESDLHWQSLEQPCSPLGDVTGEVMCSSGISASITRHHVVIGSPGSFEWQGNVHVAWMNPDLQFDTRWSSFSNQQHRNIYTGYSVLQAPALLSQEEETIVAGAPKDRKEDGRGSVLLAVQRANQLLTLQTLRGQQTGSYFGNAVAAVDLNDDGWAELLVGAPFYFQRQPEVGGAVYVYLNVGGALGQRPSAALTGPAGSAFGMAVAAAGDLDGDGFQDFAVGAPFHGTGSVMIWNGGRGGVTSQPSQVIRGSQVSPRFHTFGFSLSGGRDVDGNQYPDLLIGSLDDTVALLRTRPVLQVNQTLRVSPDIVDPINCHFCIQVELCFSSKFTAGETSDITLQFWVDADVSSLPARLQFQTSAQNRFSGSLSMSSDRCESLRVGLMEPVRHLVEPLVFSLNFSLVQKPPRRTQGLQDLQRFPLLSRTPQPVRTQVHFLKACGSDHRCHSNLQMAARFMDQNLTPFPVLKDRPVLVHYGTASRLYLEVNVTNSRPLSPGSPAEDAHNTVLNVSIPALLSYSGVRTKITKGGAMERVECSVGGAVLLCEMGNPFRSKQEVQLLIIFQTLDFHSEVQLIQSVLQLSTLSQQDAVSPVSASLWAEFQLRASLTLTHQPGHAFFGGEVLGESAARRSRDIGGALLFSFRVDVDGKLPAHLGTLQLQFDWPWQLANGKWLLYLTRVEVGGASETRCNPPGNIVNPLNLTLSPEEEEGRGRSLEQGQELIGRREAAVLSLHGHQREPYTLDCVDGARCVRFVCPLADVERSALVAVRARLWSSSLVEDYSGASSVKVRGRASLQLKTSETSVSLEDISTQFELLILPAAGLQAAWNSAPLWILLLSVLAGLLLLVLLSLLLWKCGFFERGSEWRAVALHRGRMVLKEEQPHTDADGFLIQDISQSRNRKSARGWVTWWSEAR